MSYIFNDSGFLQVTVEQVPYTELDYVTHRDIQPPKATINPKMVFAYGQFIVDCYNEQVGESEQDLTSRKFPKQNSSDVHAVAMIVKMYELSFAASEYTSQIEPQVLNFLANCFSGLQSTLNEYVVVGDGLYGAYDLADDRLLAFCFAQYCKTPKMRHSLGFCVCCKKLFLRKKADSKCCSAKCSKKIYDAQRWENRDLCVRNRLEKRLTRFGDWCTGQSQSVRKDAQYKADKKEIDQLIFRWHEISDGMWQSYKRPIITHIGTLKAHQVMQYDASPFETELLSKWDEMQIDKALKDFKKKYPIVRNSTK